MRAAWLLLVLPALVGVTACTAAEPSAPQISPALGVEADRPTPNGQTVRRCGSHYANEFDAGVASRVVDVGRVSLVAFRVSPDPGEGAPVRGFKVMIRLEPGAEAGVEITTPGTSLLYDRARFLASNVYRLGDGDRSVRFIGCAGEPAVFNGAILTTGPQSVALTIREGDQRRAILIGAYK